MLSMLMSLHRPVALNDQLSQLMEANQLHQTHARAVRSIAADALQSPSLLNSSIALASSYLALPPLFRQLLAPVTSSVRTWTSVVLSSVSAVATSNSHEQLGEAHLRRRLQKSEAQLRQHRSILDAVRQSRGPPLELFTSSPLCHGWFAARHRLLRFIPDLYALENRSVAGC